MILLMDSKDVQCVSKLLSIHQGGQTRLDQTNENEEKDKNMTVWCVRTCVCVRVRTQPKQDHQNLMRDTPVVSMSTIHDWPNAVVVVVVVMTVTMKTVPTRLPGPRETRGAHAEMDDPSLILTEQGCFRGRMIQPKVYHDNNNSKQQQQQHRRSQNETRTVTTGFGLTRNDFVLHSFLPSIYIYIYIVIETREHSKGFWSMLVDHTDEKGRTLSGHNNKKMPLALTAHFGVQPTIRHDTSAALARNHPHTPRRVFFFGVT